MTENTKNIESEKVLKLGIIPAEDIKVPEIVPLKLSFGSGRNDISGRNPIWERIYKMRVEKMKNVGQFPNELIPLVGVGRYQFKRMMIEGPEIPKILDKIVEVGEGKLFEKDIEIFRYTNQIVVIRVKINELNGYLNIFELEDIDHDFKKLFVVTLETGLSVPVGYDLKEVRKEIIGTIRDVGLGASKKSNIFTPIFYTIKEINDTTTDNIDNADNIVTIIPEFLQKIKAFEDKIRYPTFCVDTIPL